MKRSKFLKIGSVVLALVLAVGATMAYFTDYATTSTSGTSGTVAVSLDSDINLLDADGQDIINPGDQRDASFAVTNEGNKSIDVRTTVALTALDHEGNAINFTGDAATQSEYDLYLASDVELVEGKGYAPKAGAEPIQVKSIDGNVITYVLPEYSLNGNSDKYDEVETIDGINAFTKDNEFVFVMKGAAGNEWQASSVMIDVLVEAKQHENTNAGWDIVAQETVTSGSINQSAVLAESIITDGTSSDEGNEEEPVEKISGLIGTPEQAQVDWTLLTDPDFGYGVNIENDYAGGAFRNEGSLYYAYNRTDLDEKGLPDLTDGVGTHLVIDDSVSRIGSYAAFQCANLTEVTIPTSVTEIGQQAFGQCANLTVINYEGSEAEWNAITFGSNWSPAGATINFAQ